VLPAVDFHEYFIDLEGVTVASMLLLQSPGIDARKLDPPQADRFLTEGYAAFESVVEPDRVAGRGFSESQKGLR
jgi:hypothetical protein